MHIDPLAPGEQYATLAHIRESNDLPAIDTTIGYVSSGGDWLPLWVDHTGQPIKVRIRALSFTERREALQAAKDDDLALLFEVAWRALQEPKIKDRAQALEVLGARHPQAIEYIATVANDLGQYSSHVVISMVRDLAGLTHSDNPTPGN